ncbi:aromatase/cyclase [Streptomyces cellulosae]|uniref:Aromatase/cyclase n=3 Tax=Streptomyces TaxID=1883 RepID=A0ABU3JC32_9ACTN|nr:aromatase/cyclase [Streptomyces cellulosae]MDQ0489478.1 aromatase [Streptomyces thermodiastaticus]MDT6972618.1 aromatase/cyclase [Streptomyces thermocarboxydus]MDX3417634.1 aromatase/cyclase [Streptomyces sp. MD20-1-1]WSB40232.1 aromatase/cyclase [Streptomyces cellulosae]
MSEPDRRSAVHTADIAAEPREAYRLIADVLHWPLLFSPCVWSQVLETGTVEPAAPVAAARPVPPARPPGGSTVTSERIRLWAVVGSDVRSWVSRRTLDADALRIDFRQQQPSPPITEMRGHWQFEEPVTAGSHARLLLGHAWATAGPDPTAGDRIEAALDSNSEREIAAVKNWAERPQSTDELIFSFSDEVLVDGPLDKVYDFLYRADLWPERLPHVTALDLQTEPESAAAAGAEIQTMDMETRAPDGSVHPTQSVRLCFRDRQIVYKQTSVPRGLLGHSGEWLLNETPRGTLVTARHSVALDPDAIGEVLGTGTDLALARTRVREALGGNSRRTLEQARRHVEAAGRAAVR